MAKSRPWLTSPSFTQSNAHVLPPVFPFAHMPALLPSRWRDVYLSCSSRTGFQQRIRKHSLLKDPRLSNHYYLKKVTVSLQLYWGSYTNRYTENSKLLTFFFDHHAWRNAQKGGSAKYRDKQGMLFGINSCSNASSYSEHVINFFWTVTLPRNEDILYILSVELKMRYHHNIVK